MSLSDIGIVAILFVILSSIGLAVCRIVFKKSVRFVFTVILTDITGIMFLSGAVICHYEFRIINLFITAGIMAVCCQVMISWFMKYLLGPIRTINECLDALTKGDFTRTLETGRQDEMGEILRKINTMTTELSVLINAIKGNADENLKMAANLSDLSGIMSEDAGNTSSRADTVASAARDMNDRITAVVKAMAQASENISIVANAVEENTSSINEIATHTEKARLVAEDAAVQAKNASERVKF